MTNPAWYTEPTNESCRWCGKQFLTLFEVQSRHLCTACFAAGVPDDCTCVGIHFCAEGIHVRLEEWTLTDGKKQMVEVVRRVRSSSGALVLECCPTQEDYYRRKRGRA